MALTGSKIKIKTPSSLKEISLYTLLDDMITPLEPLPVRVGSNTLYAPLYPPKNITGDNVYVYTKDKKYWLKEDNTAPIPTTWTNYNVPFGKGSPIAAGNGMFMYVGWQNSEYRCYTSTDGITWTRKTNPLPNNQNGNPAFLAFIGNEFFCGFLFGGRIFRSSNGNEWYENFSLMPGDSSIMNMAANYWNQKAPYFIFLLDNKVYFSYVRETSPDSRQYLQPYPSIDRGSRFVFWNKQIYILGLQMFWHFDSTDNTTVPVKDTNFNSSSILPGSVLNDGTYVSMMFIPYGNSLYAVYNSMSQGWIARATSDGYSFTGATLPFLTPSAITGIAITRGEDISKRLGIISTADTWYAYDHMAGTQPVPIISTTYKIESIVSVNGIYLAQERSDATSRSQRLWVASFP
jgi:hypothetical protein